MKININQYILIILLLISGISTQNFESNISCSICNNIIKDKEYYVDAWGNPFHMYHKRTGIFCECCSRIISEKITNGGYKLDDGRYICTLCDVSVVKSEKEIENSLNRVLDILKDNNISNLIREELKINLINRNSMSEQYKFHEVEHLKGLTKVIPSEKEIFNIFILNNLPKIQFEAILAHELLHVWLFKKNINLSKPIMEGFCNLGSYLIYKLDDTKFSRIHLLSLENESTNSNVTEYKILKSIMDTKGFNYVTKNIGTIDIE